MLWHTRSKSRASCVCCMEAMLLARGANSRCTRSWHKTDSKAGEPMGVPTITRPSCRRPAKLAGSFHPSSPSGQALLMAWNAPGGGGGKRRLEAGREVHVALPRAGGERPWLRRPARRVGLLHSRGGAPSKQEGAHSSKDGRGTNEGTIIYNPKLMQGPYVQRTDVCCELGMQGCRVCRKANASKSVTLNRALTRRDLMPVIAPKASGIGRKRRPVRR